VLKLYFLYRNNHSDCPIYGLDPKNSGNKNINQTTYGFWSLLIFASTLPKQKKKLSQLSLFWENGKMSKNDGQNQYVRKIL